MYSSMSKDLFSLCPTTKSPQGVQQETIRGFTF